MTKPTVGEELVALRAEIKFGLEQVRQELKGIHNQFKDLNGSVDTVVGWRLNHINEHAIAEKIAVAKQSVWHGQLALVSGAATTGAGVAAAVIFALNILGVI